jgi:ribosomal protein S27E
VKQSPPLVCPGCCAALVVYEGSASSEIVCPYCGQVTLLAKSAGTAPSPSTREVYNIVTDIATGVNVRRRDNLLQLAVICVALTVGAVTGALVVNDRVTGAVVGGFIGLLVGLFGSGIYLMVYRFVCHFRGHHR